MNAPTSRRYKLLKSALPAAESTVQSLYRPVLIVCTAGMVGSFLLGSRSGAGLKWMISFAVIFGLTLIYLSVFIPRNARQRVRQMWDTYDLEIGANYLLRRQADLPDLRLQFDEVQRVEQSPGRYLLVIGNSRRQVIEIPQGIENFEEILSTVSTISPIQAPRVDWWRKRVMVMAAGIAGTLATLWSTSPAIVAPLSFGMSVYFLRAFVRIRRNPNCSPSTRRVAWLYLLFILVCAMKLLEAIGRHVQP
jgi:hypothetical protein